MNDAWHRASLDSAPTDIQLTRMEAARQTRQTTALSTRARAVCACIGTATQTLHVLGIETIRFDPTSYEHFTLTPARATRPALAGARLDGRRSLHSVDVCF